VVEDSVQTDESAIVAHWLESTWKPIEQILKEWSLEHLFQTYRHRFRGTEYIVSNQWTLW